MNQIIVSENELRTLKRHLMAMLKTFERALEGKGPLASDVLRASVAQLNGAATVVNQMLGH